jgi:hypothetical protein
MSYSYKTAADKKADAQADAKQRDAKTEAKAEQVKKDVAANTAHTKAEPAIIHNLAPGREPEKKAKHPPAKIGHGRYSFGMGRQILRDGVPFISIDLQGATQPREGDQAAHVIVRLFNAADKGGLTVDEQRKAREARDKQLLKEHKVTSTSYLVVHR